MAHGVNLDAQYRFNRIQYRFNQYLRQSSNQPQASSPDQHPLSNGTPVNNMANRARRQRVPRLPAFGSEPANVDTQLQHFQAAAPQTPSALDMTAPTESMCGLMEQQIRLQTNKINRQLKKQGLELEDIKEAYQHDLQTLQRHIDSSLRQLGQSTEVVQHQEQFLPTEELSDESSAENFVVTSLDEAGEKELLADLLREQNAKVSSPVRSLAPGRFSVETDEAVVDVILQHVQGFQTERGRVDSGLGSPQRAQATPASHVCCTTQFDNKEDLISHVQGAHIKSGDVYLPAPTSSWRPAAIRNLAAKPISGAAAYHNGTFTYSFLRELMGGEQWSDGFYFNGSSDCILPSQGYWLVVATYEPYMPQTLGQHGAKLTAFLNDPPVDSSKVIVPDTQNYLNTPVFVSADGGKSYRYLGQYSQLRWSDKIGFDTQVERIPQSVLRHHAEQLARVGRPPWVTWSLKNHFWPKPNYLGPIPADSAIHTPNTTATPEGSNGGLERRVQAGLNNYAQKLKEWEKDSDEEVQLLHGEKGVADILKGFNMDDMQNGLRLSWEYLECVGYEDEFYDMLVGLKQLEKHSPPKIRIGRDPTPTWAKIQENSENASKAHAASGANTSRGSGYNAACEWDDEPEWKQVKEPLYGAKSRALNRKQWREDPGVDAIKLTTKPSYPNFFDNGPVLATLGRETAVLQSMSGAIQGTTTSKAPAQLNGILPHLSMGKGKTAVVPSVPAPTTPVEKETSEKEKSDKKAIAKEVIAKETSEQKPTPTNPFGNGNLEEAKSFANDATTAKNTSSTAKSGKKSDFKPPHMRGK